MNRINGRWVKNSIIALAIIVASLVIECLFFNQSAIFHANEPITFDLNQVTPDMNLTKEELLVPLEEDKVLEIELKRRNEKLLAEVNGEEYVETVDPSVIEKDGVLYTKVYATTITLDIGKEYYIKKLSVSYPSALGYGITLMKDGEESNGTFYNSLNERLQKSVSNVNAIADQMLVTIKTSSEFSTQGLVITVSNPFRINVFRVAFFIGAMLAIWFVATNKSMLAKRLELSFALFSILFGGFIIILNGTNQLSWDEQVHYESAYRASFGQTIKYTEASIQMKGRVLPSFDSIEERELVAAYAQERNDYSVADIKHQQRFVQYNVRAYLPQAIMLAVARILQLPFSWAYMLGKFGNLLFYTLVMALAIRISKIGKIYIAMIGLLPTPLFLASAYAYDAVITALVFLGFVLWLNEILDKDKKLTWYSALAMIVCFVVGTWSKAIYIVMMLFLCFLPKEKFDARWKRAFFQIGTVILVGMLFITVYKSPIEPTGATSSLQSNTAYLGDIRALGVNFEEQVKYILDNPLTYTKVLLRSLKNSAFDYLLGSSTWLLYAYLGFFPKIFAALTTLLLLGAALFQTKEDRQYVLAVKWKVLIGIMAFSMASLVWTGLYITFTKVGSNIISGVQGRYYIPFILPLLFIFKNNKFKLNISTERFYQIIFSILVFINLYGTYVFFLKPHCF